MSGEAFFDSQLVSAAWLDDAAIVKGWFSPDLIALASGGPATYNEGFSASIAIADGLSSSVLWPNVFASSFAAGDALTAGLLFSTSLIEAVTPADSITPAAFFAASNLSSLSLLDTLGSSATLANTLSESIASAFSPVPQTTFQSSLGESIVTGSVFGATQLFSCALTDGLSLLDAYDDALLGSSATYNEVIAASLALADALIAAPTYSNALTASVTLADGATVSTIIAASLSEAISTAYNAGATQIVVSSIGESLVLTATLAVGMLVWPAPSEVMAGIQYGPNGDDFTGTAISGSGATVFAYRSDVQVSTPKLHIASRSKRRVQPQEPRESSMLRAKAGSKYAYATTSVRRTEAFTEQNEVFVTTTIESIEVN